MAFDYRGLITMAKNFVSAAFTNAKYDVSICCITKDENLYLEEWISYHIKIGVAHFYLYDNGSAVPIRDTIRNLNLDKWVTVIDFPGASQQMPAYSNCLQKFSRHSKWMAFIDTDEFIVVKSPDHLLVPFLQQYKLYGGLGIHWATFGSNGHLLKSDAPQAKRFTRRANTGFHVNEHIKTIVQPKYVRSVRDPHSFKFGFGKFCVDETFRKISGPLSPITVETIQLNHYYCRSREEFETKIKRGRSDNVDIGRSMADFDYADQHSNEVEDLLLVNITEKLSE